MDLSTKMNTGQGITLDGIKGMLPIGVMLVALALAWGSITSQITLLSQRTDTMEDKVERLDEKQGVMNETLVRLETTINDAKDRGLLTYKVTSSTIITVTPTPSPTPNLTDSRSESQPNQNVVVTQSQPESKPEVTIQNPEPTPQPSPIEEIIDQLPIIGRLL